MIVNGDCLIELKKIVQGSMDLIYLDPPFYTQKKHSLKTRDNKKEYTFIDVWSSINEYRNYIKERLFECKRVLKKTGSIFLHCDRSASHHLRIALDDVFGENNFQSEIVWSYRRWSNSKKGLLNSHQIIFFYTRSPMFKFNRVFESYSPTTNIDQIFQKRERGVDGKTVYKKAEDGSVELIDGKNGVPLSDVWEIPYLNPKANERVGYPTQKPIILLERIIELVTDKGDTVLDPFCGSGTTLVAASMMDRKYIGIDISEEAIKLTNQRLSNPIKTTSQLLQKGKSSYKNQDFGILEMLQIIDAEPVQRNKGIDGFLRVNNKVKPVPIRIQRKSEAFDDARRLLMNATQRNAYKLAILVKSGGVATEPLFGPQEDSSERLYIAKDILDVAQIRLRIVGLI